MNKDIVDSNSELPRRQRKILPFVSWRDERLTRTGATQIRFVAVVTMRSLHQNERMPITPVMISDE